MNIAEILYYKYFNEINQGKIKLQDDGQGPYIKEWNVPNVPSPDSTTLQQWELEATLLKFKSDAQNLIESHIEQTAKQRGYDNGFTCATYVSSTIPTWKAEAETFIQWRDTIWSWAFNYLAQIESGQIAIPSLEDIQANISQITWPS